MIRTIRLQAIGSVAIIATALLSTSVAPVFGHDDTVEHSHGPTAADARQVYRPTVLPDRIVLTWTSDPATTQAVTWRTSTEVTSAVAQIAIADAGPGFPLTAETITASSTPFNETT